MTRLPRITGKDVVRALEQAGFKILLTRGSHSFLRHPDGRTTVIPVHAGETLGPGLLGKILRDVDLSRDELVKLL